MPTYEYKCNECSDVKQRIVPMNKRDIVFDCDCGGAFYRVITNAARIWAPTRSAQ